MQNLEGIIQTGFDFWGDAPMSPFAGNHDIGRLATEIAGNDEGPWANSWDRMADGGDNVTEQWLIDNIAMALGATLTQQGVPLLYYGDEIGLAGSGDPDNRRTMSFEPFLSGNQRTLLAKTQRMGQARRELRGLQRGATTFLWAAQDVFAFARHTATDKVVVVINRGADRTTTIPIQGLIEDGVTLRDRMVDRTFGVANGELTVSLGGNDVAILAP
jgi:glycosidase